MLEIVSSETSSTMKKGGDISKLPKWARDHIAALERKTAAAEKICRVALDHQTPSKVWREDWRDGEFNKVYFQSGDYIYVESAGVKLRIHLHPDDHIFFSYERADHKFGECAIVPTTHQQFKITTGDNLRK